MGDLTRSHRTSPQHTDAIRRDTTQALRLSHIGGGARPRCGMGGFGSHEQSPTTGRFASRAKPQGRLGWETDEAFSHDDRLGGAAAADHGRPWAFPDLAYGCVRPRRAAAL